MTVCDHDLTFFQLMSLVRKKPESAVTTVTNGHNGQKLDKNYLKVRTKVSAKERSAGRKTRPTATERAATQRSAWFEDAVIDGYCGDGYEDRE